MNRNKSARFWWAMYDFGNSIAIIVFYVFFPLWLVNVKGGTDTLYNWAFVLSSILFLIFAPYLGNLADRNRTYIKGLFWSTLLTGISYLAVSFTTVLPGSPLWLCFTLFTIAFFLYQLTFVYYTPLLRYISQKQDISPNTKSSLEKNSGIGQTANYLGQVAGLLLALPFIKGTIRFGETSLIASAFIPSTIIFLIIALFALYKIHTSLNGTIQTVRANDSMSANPRITTQNTMFGEVRKLFAIGGIGVFFVTYFLISDAVLTLSGNASLYLTALFPQISSSQVAYIILAILTMSALGAYVFGKITHRIGSSRAFMTVLIGWLVIFTTLMFANGFPVHLFLFLLAGFFLGPVWVVSRVILIEKVPESKLGIASSVYTLAERFSTFIGPLFWSASLSIFAYTGNTKYKFASGSLLIVVIVALLVWRKTAIKSRT